MLSFIVIRKIDIHRRLINLKFQHQFVKCWLGHGVVVTSVFAARSISPRTMAVWYYLIMLNMYVGSNTGIPASGVFLVDILNMNKADKHRKVRGHFY